jgi:hypothetical protein
MSTQRPLGATQQGGVGLTGGALGVRTRYVLSTTRLGLGALTGLVASTLLLTVAAACSSGQ